MNPWDWLGIDEAAGEAEVKRAYAKALRRHRPDEDPTGFQTTHEAFRIALHWARQRAAWAVPETDEGADRPGATEAAEPAAAADPPLIDTGDPDSSPDTVTATTADPIPESPMPEADIGDPATDAGPPPRPSDTAIDVAAIEGPDPGSRTREILPLGFDAPLLRRLLTESDPRIDLAALSRELSTALAALSTEQRQWIADRVAAAVESASAMPAPGVVTVLAEQLDWDSVFLRHRPDCIVERLAADEAHAALQARLQDPASLSPALRALTRPVRLLDRASWPLWFSTRKVGAELMQIRAEAASAVSLLDAGAVRLTEALLDARVIGRERVWRWLGLGSLFGLAVAMLLLLLAPDARPTSTMLWSVAGSAGALLVTAAYLRARVRQIYALPLEAARQLWFVALLLGLFLLGAALPETLGPLLGPLAGLAAGTTIGRTRLLPGLLLLGAALMLPAALRPLIGPLPDGWASATLTLLTALVLALDYGIARWHGLTLEEARLEERPLYLLGGAVFLALILVGAATEESRKPVPVRPTHAA